MKSMNGYILAGGKSSRMGKDKGLMLLDDKAIVQHVIDAIKPVVDNVVIVSNNSEYEKFGLELIEDLIKGIGPAGGIYSALNHCTTENIFIVSCDMPFVTSEAIKFIIDNSTHSEITLALQNQNIEPLFGVYTKACLPKWKELIETGIIQLKYLATHFNLFQLNVDGNELFGEKVFSNLNTKVDFENAIEYRNRKAS